MLSRNTPVVRYLELEEVIQPLTIQPPLRILAVIASPSGYPPLDVEQEWSKLQESVGDLVERGLVVLDRLQQPTLSSLQQRLRRADYHVFHFVGHGAFDAREQDGMLLMQDSAGAGRPVSGQDLGTLLHDQSTLRLAVLNACEGARTSRTDPFAGTAQSLLQQGIPAVIAMQFEISDAAAITISHEFYAAVADSYPVDAALAEARKAVFADSNATEWGTPVLYMRAPDGRIFDVAHDAVTPVVPPKEAAVPPPAVVTAPKTTRDVPEAAMAALASSTTQDARPATRRTLPAGEMAVPARKLDAAAIPSPVSRRKHTIWPAIAAGLIILLAAGVFFSRLGRSPLEESSAALPLAAGVAHTPTALRVRALPPTREQGAVAAVLGPTATAPPAVRSGSKDGISAAGAAAASDTPLPAPTATLQPPTSTPQPPTNTPQLPTNTPLTPTDTPQPPTSTPQPPPTAAPTRAPTATRALPTSTPAIASAAPAAGSPLDFGGSGSWVRGNQPYGTLTTVSGADGRKYGKLDYNIPATVTDHFVVFRRLPALTLAGQPQAMTLWVYGDGSGNFLNLWIRDQAGQIRQFPLGRIQHANSWQPMIATLDTSAPWPQARIDGPDSLQLSYPVSVYAVTLDAFPRSDATAYAGTIYLDQLRTGVEAGKGPSAAPPP